jgi:hypothetical protein
MTIPVKSTPNRIFSFKAILWALIIYALIAGLIAILITVYQDGLDTFALLLIPLALIPLISLILFIISLTFVINGRKSQTIPAVIHGLVLLAAAYIFFSGR